MKIKVLISFFLFLGVFQSDQFFKVNSIGLNIRSKPSSGGIILGELKQGDTIIAIESKGNWIAFNYKKDKTGYVNKAYLDLLQITPKVKLLDTPKNEAPSFLDLVELSSVYYLYFLLCIIFLALFKHYLL